MATQNIQCPVLLARNNIRSKAERMRVGMYPSSFTVISIPRSFGLLPRGLKKDSRYQMDEDK